MNRLQKAARKQERHQRQVAARLAKRQERAVQVEVEDDDGDIDLEAGDVIEETPPTETETTETIEEGTDPIDDVDGVTSHIKSTHTHSDDPEEAPALQKDYQPGTMIQEDPIGATSFAELDAERAAEEQAHQVRMTSFDVEGLVRNILDHPMMDAAEKATAIQAVGSQFQERIDSILTGDGEDMQKDIELLELEAIIAIDKRHTPIAEKVGDWINKAVLTTAGRKNLSAGQFALVVTRGGKTIKKYPIHDKAHVRNALARAAQQIKRGGQGAADARAALPKIHAAAKRMGIGMGKSLSSGIIIQKDAKGDWRWVGWPTNNFIDWQGDILSKEAHQEYEKFLDANPEMMPAFMSWHTPETTRVHPVDYAHFENGFMIMSGILEEHEAAALFKAQAATDLGMSMQGFGLRESDDPRVVTKYRIFEVSDLPLDSAANPFTDLQIMIKEVDVDKKEYLTTIMGSADKAEAFIKKTELKQKELEKAGIESKAKEADPVAAPDPAKVAKVVTKAQTEKPGDVDAVVEAVLKAIEIDGLNDTIKALQEAADRVPLLEAVVKDMQTGEDERLAAKISPPAKRFAWMRADRASTSESTKVEKDDELAKRTPGLGDDWLSAATGTTPIDVEAVRA